MGMITLWQPHRRVATVSIGLQLASGNVSSTCKPRLGDNMPLTATFVGWCSEASFTLQEWPTLQPTLTFLTPWVHGTHGSRPHHISCATTTQKPFYSFFGNFTHVYTVCQSNQPLILPPTPPRLPFLLQHLTPSFQTLIVSSQSLCLCTWVQGHPQEHVESNRGISLKKTDSPFYTCF